MKYITELMQSGNLTTGKGLAANSVKRDYGGAYKCYKHAQEIGAPIMNIADNIKNQEWQTVDSKRFDFSFMWQNGLKKSEKYAII